ncbi:MAG: hypothetical protein JNN27_05310 [Planctomycetes bacterium]|nr:hypothetical protein [Planctomycetota bacterium]
MVRSLDDGAAELSAQPLVVLLKGETRKRVHLAQIDVASLEVELGPELPLEAEERDSTCSVPDWDGDGRSDVAVASTSLEIVSSATGAVLARHEGVRRVLGLAAAPEPGAARGLLVDLGPRAHGRYCVVQRDGSMTASSAFGSPVGDLWPAGDLDLDGVSDYVEQRGAKFSLPRWRLLPAMLGIRSGATGAELVRLDASVLGGVGVDLELHVPGFDADRDGTPDVFALRRDDDVGLIESFAWCSGATGRLRAQLPVFRAGSALQRAHHGAPPLRIPDRDSDGVDDLVLAVATWRLPFCENLPALQFVSGATLVTLGTTEIPGWLTPENCFVKLKRCGAEGGPGLLVVTSGDALNPPTDLSRHWRSIDSNAALVGFDGRVLLRRRL